MYLRYSELIFSSLGCPENYFHTPSVIIVLRQKLLPYFSYNWIWLPTSKPYCLLATFVESTLYLQDVMNIVIFTTDRPLICVAKLVMSVMAHHHNISKYVYAENNPSYFELILNSLFRSIKVHVKEKINERQKRLLMISSLLFLK